MDNPIDPSWVDVSLDLQIPEANPLGVNLTYAILVTNAGPAMATQVVVTNLIPLSFAGPVVTVSQGAYSIFNSTLRADLGVIPPGGTASITVQATPTTAGVEQITASVGSWEFDYASLNNSVQRLANLGVADLAVLFQTVTNQVHAGVPFPLTIILTNQGPDLSPDSTLFNSGSLDFVCSSYTLSQGQVLEVREEGVPYRVDTGPIAPSNKVTLGLTLIPKRTGELNFFSSVSGSLIDLVETNDFSLLPIPVTNGPGIIQFSAPKISVRESSREALVEVQRHDGAEGTVQVDVATRNGTALAGQDYSPLAQTIVFSPGETNHTITFVILDNPYPECNREFAVAASNVLGGAFLYGNTNLSVVIQDDDPAATGSLEPVAIPRTELNTGFGDTALSTLTPDGRWLAFSSSVTNLVPNDTNQTIDVFLKDLESGEIRLVSVNRFGSNSGNRLSWLPVITPDGRFVAFDSYSDDLVTNQVTLGQREIYLRDLLTGTTVLVTATPAGTGADWGMALNENYATMGVSTNGRFVAFLNDGQTLSNGRSQVFVRDMQAKTNHLVTVKFDGSGPVNADVFEASLSADGNRIAFASIAKDLVAGFSDAASFQQIYLRDLSQHQTIPVSISSIDQGPGRGTSASPGLTPDGRQVLFRSFANDLVADDDNPFSDVFLRDLGSNTTRRVSRGVYGPCDTATISSDGRFIAFRGGFSPGSSQVTSNSSQIYLHDCWSNTTTLVSLNCSAAAPGNAHSLNPAITANGRFVFFQSFATDLVGGVFNGEMNLYRRDLLLGATVLVSQNRTLSGGGSDDSALVNVSADGSLAVLPTLADDLVYEDNNGFIDLFVWRANGTRSAQPRLSISRPNSQVVVRWPRGATNFILQGSPDLGATNWTDLPGMDQTYQADPPGRSFFRLRSAP